MSVHDVASYILEKKGPMTAMKLQKLTYYSQAWSLVFDERPLFDDPIEAWANGPVVPALYSIHRGSYSVSSWEHGCGSNLDSDARETIDVVLKAYSDFSSLELSNLTHSEDPWIKARAGLEPNQRGTQIIENSSMEEFYTGVYQSMRQPEVSDS